MAVSVGATSIRAGHTEGKGAKKQKHQFSVEGQAVSAPLSFPSGRGRPRQAEEPATQHRSYARSNPGTRPTRRQTRRQTSSARVKGGPRARFGGARKGVRESHPRGGDKEHGEKSFPSSKSRSEPRGTKQEPSNLFKAFSIRFFDLARKVARSGTKRNQRGTKLRGANLPYQEPSRPKPPHLLYILLLEGGAAEKASPF